MGSRFDIFEFGQIALLLGIVVLIWPWRRVSRLVVTRTLRSTPDAVWDAVIDVGEITDNTGERHPLIPRGLVSRTKVSEDPEVWENVYDNSGGRRAVLSLERRRVLWRERPHRYVEQWNDTPLPRGADAFTDYRLEEAGDGTRYTVTRAMVTGSLWHHLQAKRHITKQADRMASFFAAGEVPPVPATQRRLLVSIVVSVLAVASFALWLGLIAGLLVAAVLLLHEFGHWLAFRLTGQPSSRLMLIPFFGGMAIPQHRHKSAFDEAFCALMGAGLSAVVCGMLLAVWLLLGAPPAFPRGGHHQAAIFVLRLAAAIGLVNLFQLLPIPPLDGGVLLRTILQSTKSSMTRPALLLVACGACAFAASKGAILLALVAGIGALQVYAMQSGASAVRPMLRHELATIAAGVVVTVVLHVTPILLLANHGFDLTRLWS